MPHEQRIGGETIRISSYLMRARSQSPVRHDEAVDEERPQYARRFISFFLQSRRPQALRCNASIQVQDWVAGFDRFDQVKSFVHDLRHDRLYYRSAEVTSQMYNEMKKVLLVHMHCLHSHVWWGPVVPLASGLCIALDPSLTMGGSSATT